MPYIEQSRRRHLVDGDTVPETAGDLNFLITRLCNAFVERHGLSYATTHDVTGVLHDVLTEFDRRVVAPYEDQKRADNGDVYSPDVAL